MEEQSKSAQSRRMFLKTSVAAAGGLTVGTFLRTVSAQAKVTTIRTGYTLAPEHPVGQALRRWGDNLTKKTNGAYVVQVHAGGVLGNSRTASEGVSMGTLESYWIDPAECASFNQALNIDAGAAAPDRIALANRELYVAMTRARQLLWLGEVRPPSTVRLSR